MAEFSLTLQGKADADSVREAFNSAVRTIRDTVDEAFELDGELTVDGVAYTPDEVPDAADTTEADAEAPAEEPQA